MIMFYGTPLRRQILSDWGAFSSPPSQLILALYMAIHGIAREQFPEKIPSLK